MKKQFIKLTTALVLLSTLMLGACNNPVSPAPREDIAAGKGLVRVETGAAAARTAVPTVSFAKYEYWFAKGSDAAAQETPVAGVFELDAGSYTVTVKAFVAAGDTSPATQGTSGVFTITAGADAGSIRVVLEPVIGAGQGTLSFALAFPDAAEVTAFTLTRVGGADSFDLKAAGTAGTGTLSGTQAAIGAGYWLARASLQKGGVYVGKSEVAHIYDDMTTALNWTFAEENFAAIPVVSAADSGPGTLREALTRANAGLGGKIFVDLPEGGNVITLATPLPQIRTSLVIEGNGATLTQNGFASGADTQLLNIDESGAVVTIRRLHFKGGQATEGGAIFNAGELALESCIFSGNRATSGGAIRTTGSLTVKACTFYNNNAYNGGGIYYYVSEASPAVSLTGNLFSGNTAPVGNIVGTADMGGTGAISNGYNVSDRAAGVIHGSGDPPSFSGYEFAYGDVGNVALSISPVNFRPFFDSAALNKLSALPVGYPSVDFYGATISAGGASGAVQTPAVAGYYLDYGVAAGQGTVYPDFSPNSEGLYASNTSVTLTASCGSSWVVLSWTVDGVESGNSDTLVIAMNAHKIVRVSFAQDVTVNNEAELRAALNNQTDGDIIRFGADITLSVVLPTTGSKIVIEGNGHILTQAEGTTFGGSGSQVISNETSLLPTGGGPVTVRRLHFKDGSSRSFGGAITTMGSLILESCVFSGNRSSGAIYAGGATATVTVKGCTFFNNHADGSGGAIYRAGGTIILTGNLFFGNTATTAGNAVYGSGVTSYGYNVSDKGNGLITTTNAVNKDTASGYAFITNDVGNVALPISPVNFKPLSGRAALNNLPSTLPADYPSKDFYGIAIPASGASGAVQTQALGWSLDYEADKVEVLTGTTNEDGLYGNGASVTLKARAEIGVFGSWTINETDGGSDNPLTITMNAHKTVRALFTSITVNDEAGLRDALKNQTDGDTIRFGADITLSAVLPNITTSIVIEGDGHTLTRTFAAGQTTHLLRVTSSTATVSVRRLHFKNGLTSGAYGGALLNEGRLVLESCIFSGNQSSNYGGGAIFTNTGSLTVKACTFYNNKSTGGNNSNGGAIYRSGGTLTLTGNLFFGNTVDNAGHVVYGVAGVTSGGYNVSDKEGGLITSTSAPNKDTASGYVFESGDVGNVVALPISPANFKPITGGAALGVLTSLPVDYPSVDFYGTAISVGGAAGAVQDQAASGFYLDYGVAFGEGGIEPTAPGADGLYSSGTNVMLTPEPGVNFTFDSWTIDGSPGGSDNPLSITMNAHKTVLAAFKPNLAVSNEAGLRAALDWQTEGDTITFGADITLSATLPQITKSITIEGNGYILTRTFAGGASTNLLYIDATDATVKISRLHFKDGLSNTYAAGIRSNGNLTLESCIFSGNESGTSGGAVYTSAGTLTVKGCTFYNNRVTGTTSAGVGGAIYRGGGIVVLTGNLFSGNTAGNGGNVVYGASVTSLGYNVSDKEDGAVTSTSAANKQTASGYVFADTDLGPVTDITFDAASKPSSATSLKTLTGLPTTPADFPAAYFDGTPRSAPATAGAVLSD